MVLNRPLLIAGGGTGGHFFCGLAIAEKYLERNPKSSVKFVGVQRGIEGRYRLEDPRMSVSFIRASGFKNKGVFGKFESIMDLMGGFIQCLFIILKLKPGLVIGVGGYASAPGVLAASILKFFLRFRILIVEQNSVPGLANRLLSYIPLEAFSAFPYSRFVTVDLPIRRAVEKHLLEVEEVRWPPQEILIMGGSQGAAGLNKAWIQILPKLKEYQPQMRFVHQAGSSGLDFVEAAYRDLQFQADCFSFSNDIADYVKKADLVISRAGALSIFELMSLNRPTVLVPFPHAADDHQYKNARQVQELDWIIPEQELNWDRIEKVFASKQPKNLKKRFQVRASWRALI